MVSTEIFVIEMFVNHQASEHISFYSRDCYICHLNFLTTARWNDGEMLHMPCKNSNSMR